MLEDTKTTTTSSGRYTLITGSSVLLDEFKGKEAQGEVKNFPLGVILSVTTGILLPCGNRPFIYNLYDILGWMTQQELSTIGLLPASEVCKPELLRQLPHLKEVDFTSASFRLASRVWKIKNWESWLNSLEKKYGAQHPVQAF